MQLKFSWGLRYYKDSKAIDFKYENKTSSSLNAPETEVVTDSTVPDQRTPQAMFLRGLVTLLALTDTSHSPHKT